MRELLSKRKQGIYALIICFYEFSKFMTKLLCGTCLIFAKFAKLPFKKNFVFIIFAQLNFPFELAMFLLDTAVEKRINLFY